MSRQLSTLTWASRLFSAAKLATSASSAAPLAQPPAPSQAGLGSAPPLTNSTQLTQASPPAAAPGAPATGPGGLYPGHVPVSLFERSLLVVGSAVTSLLNTHRHDMVAVLSETTGGPFLARLRIRMRETRGGRRLLRERPRITEESINLEKLALLPKGTFGRAYVDWLKRNKVTPDTRDPVRYIDDPELAYIMQRYRESHDFYHVLLGFGVSLPAELVVKWFELANFALPVAALSSAFGPLAMEASERRRLIRTYGRWALECGGSSQCLIGLEWERLWEKDLVELRREVGVTKPPVPFGEWRAEGRRLKAEREALERAQAGPA